MGDFPDGPTALLEAVRATQSKRKAKAEWDNRRKLEFIDIHRGWTNYMGALFYLDDVSNDRRAHRTS